MPDLIETLATHPDCVVVRRAGLDGFFAAHPHVLLFFTGDTGQRPEGLDVAIAARELVKAHAGRLKLGIVDRRDETAVMSRTGVVVLPALAFIAHGRTVEVVARMRDWDAYAQAARRLFEQGATAP
jgi:thioredoxin-like negative regulator of GroEL